MKEKQPFLTRGELAQRAGVHLETIRFYESKALLPAPTRSPSGYRQYDPTQVKRLKFIQRAQELGFTLKEIKEVFSLKASPKRSSERVKRLTEEKLTSIAAKIRDLQRMHRVLTQVSSACNGKGETGNCPILRALDGDFDSTPCQTRRGLS